jgi:hypothetical protein
MYKLHDSMLELTGHAAPAVPRLLLLLLLLALCYFLCCCRRMLGYPVAQTQQPEISIASTSSEQADSLSQMCLFHWAHCV